VWPNVSRNDQASSRYGGTRLEQASSSQPHWLKFFVVFLAYLWARIPVWQGCLYSCIHTGTIRSDEQVETLIRGLIYFREDKICGSRTSRYTTLSISVYHRMWFSATYNDFLVSQHLSLSSVLSLILYSQLFIVRYNNNNNINIRRPKSLWK
jgi:hypothetical protein